jgi:hypothetical protein
MDGDRIAYVSGGKLVVFDYDYRNQQVLMSTDPTFLPFFDSGYTYAYSLVSEPVGAKGLSGGTAFASTPLRTPADQ